jgi:transposase
MSKTALKVESFRPEEIKALLRKDERFQQGVRLHACYQVALGKRPEEIAGLYDTTIKSICNWIHRLNEGGIEALADKPKPGRHNRLDASQLIQVRDCVLYKSPVDFGYNSATWTGPLLIAWIKSEYNIEYKKAQIYNILKKLGLTFQKAKGIYPEAKDRDEKVSELKKTRKGKEKQ